MYDVSKKMIMLFKTSILFIDINIIQLKLVSSKLVSEGEPMNILGFISYVIITSITPGPSNILMMNEARRFGFIGSWRFSSDIFLEFVVFGFMWAVLMKVICIGIIV